MSESLISQARRLRMKTIERSLGPGHHLGACLSAIEIVTAIFARIDNDQAGKFILSKGHAYLPYYLALVERGVLREDPSMPAPLVGDLIGHPCRQLAPGVIVSTGSLGQGLSIAMGLGIAGNMSGSKEKVYVLAGDGELQSGQSWEALGFAARHSLSNVCVVVDANSFQADGPTPPALDSGHPRALASLGLRVEFCDGHDASALYAALDEFHMEKCQVIFARTTKGKGVSFMENSPEWFTGALSEYEMKAAVAEVQGAR